MKKILLKRRVCVSVEVGPFFDRNLYLGSHTYPPWIWAVLTARFVRQVDHGTLCRAGIIYLSHLDRSLSRHRRVSAILSFSPPPPAPFICRALVTFAASNSRRKHT